MKVFVYTIKDTVTGAFSEFITHVNGESALRWFRDFCSKAYTKNDLQLFLVGEFDTQSGDFKPCLEFIKGGCDL